MYGTATYQVWYCSMNISERTEAAKITDKHVKVSLHGIKYNWDHQGNIKPTSSAYICKLISYELDGVVTVIKK